MNPSDLGREKFGEKKKVKRKLSPSMETSASMEYSGPSKDRCHFSY